MKTLIGMVITCTVEFSSWHPQLNMPVSMKAENIGCTVIDDRLMSVGTPDFPQTPIVVDCSKAIEWLKPIKKNGIFMFFKEDGDCEYDYVR
jgi:hypothetical protein